MSDYTKKIRIGNKYIGGGEPILIQSMCNTDTRNIERTISQITKLQDVGCDIIRVAILDKYAALAIKEIKKQTKIPIVADIHFDYKLAISAIENGADKIRINPGNIGGKEAIEAVTKKAKEYDIPIRVGVNGGSLSKEIIEKHGGITTEALVESALSNVEILENFGFDNIVVSVKVSNVLTTIEVYKKIAKMCNYPLHIGVTEAGTTLSGTVKNTLAIGNLLSCNIGDTMRISLTAEPEKEVEVGWQILKSLGLRKRGIDFVSCPTCGRTRVNMIPIAESVEKAVSTLDKNIKVSVMGCAVNGPGEARDADFGVACGVGEGLLFKKGEIIKKVPEEDIVYELMNLIENS